ncbi:hypothetical protein [Brevirhabdus sp.]|uniref:hypothetical protein n=1 Tax=Brevirhabdus sp. TaxID=2004514 RepID=UPI004058F2AE
MNYRWLLRMSQWARNPPSWQKVALVLAIVALSLLLALYEHLWGWPEWLTVNGSPRGRLPRF